MKFANDTIGLEATCALFLNGHSMTNRAKRSEIRGQRQY